MKRTTLYWISTLVATAFVATGCGFGMDGGMTNTDAGINSDGGTCNVGLVVTHPDQPIAGDIITIDLESSDTILSLIWTIVVPDGTRINPNLRNQDLTAEFSSTVPGTYKVQADVHTVSGSCSVQIMVVVRARNARSETFSFLLTPADLTSTPRQQWDCLVWGETPDDSLSIPVEKGRNVLLAVHGPDENGLPAYLRLTPIDTTSMMVEGHYDPQSGPLSFSLNPSATYDILVVPDSPTVAPDVIKAQSAASMTVSSATIWPMTVGEPVTGSVVDSVGHGIYEAQVLLRCNDIPSGLGTTAMLTGSFALYARPGSCTLHVQPPKDGHLPAIDLESENLAVEMGHSLDLTISYGNHPDSAWSGRVVDENGSPVPQARITLESEAIANVAQVEIRNDDTLVETLSATGIARLILVTDDQGRWPVQTLPAGMYHVVIEPDTPTRTTVLDLDLTSDKTNQTIALALPVMVSGVVLGASKNGPVPAKDVEVQATTNVGTGSTATTSTDAAGQFSIPLIADASYQLVFIPKPKDDTSAASVLQLTTDQSGPMTLDTITLPKGLRLSGTVQDTNPANLLLQVYCTADCTYRGPLYETVAEPDGTFAVIVPDPGVNQ